METALWYLVFFDVYKTHWWKCCQTPYFVVSCDVNPGTCRSQRPTTELTRSSFHGNMLSNLTWSLVNFVCSIWSSFLGIYEATMKQRSHGKKLNGLQQYLSRRFRIINCAQHKILLHFKFCQEQQIWQFKKYITKL